MEIKNLRFFLAFAREESMSYAAEILHVTQPTLSKVLKSLEDFSKLLRHTLLDEQPLCNTYPESPYITQPYGHKSIIDTALSQAFYFPNIFSITSI